jgi:large subunit ribosomal protein L18
MIIKNSKNMTRGRIHSRIRKKMQGTPERPRLNVYRSTNHLYVQVIDDSQAATLVAATTLEFGEAKEGKRPTGGNVSAAKQLGKAIAERAKQKGITKVVFDRGGYLYHGRIKALAEAAREGGLEF